MRLSPLLLTLALGLTTLTACTASPPTMSDPAPAPSAGCDADAAKPAAIGKAATAAAVEQARVDAGARTARVLKPGQMVTMEYAEGRLNIDVNADNVITNLRCG